MAKKSAGRLRTVLVAVVTGGALAVSSCQTGGQGVSRKQACENGAVFACPNPRLSNA